MDAQAAKLIGLDWGTSALRCYRFADFGELLERRSFQLGVMQVTRTGVKADPAERDRSFEAALLEACGDWIEATPDAPLIACGMVGSNIGWSEIPYLKVPIDSDCFGAALGEIHTSSGKVIHVVPGLIELCALPNVMRGEETQVVGALSVASGRFPSGRRGDAEILIGLPGTHSKWVYVKESTIQHFDTFMTGELFRLLCEHSILGRGMDHTQKEPRYDAFDQGVRVTQESAGEGGLLSTIFSVRTLGLAGDLSPEQQPDYLSGLIIGHEVAALLKLRSTQRNVEQSRAQAILLAGESSLCARYARALASYDCEHVETAANATEWGLWGIAQQAALVPVNQKSV